MTKPKTKAAPKEGVEFISTSAQAKPRLEIVPPELMMFGGDASIELPEGVDPQNIINDSRWHLRPGSLVYKNAPETRLQMTLVPDNGTPERLNDMMQMRMDGWEEASADDFYVGPHLANYLMPSDSGRITVGGRDDSTSVVFVRHLERLEAQRARNRRASEDVGKSVESKMQHAMHAAHLRGLQSMFIDTTEDAFGNVINENRTESE